MHPLLHQRPPKTFSKSLFRARTPIIMNDVLSSKKQKRFPYGTFYSSKHMALFSCHSSRGYGSIKKLIISQKNNLNECGKIESICNKVNKKIKHKMCKK